MLSEYVAEFYGTVVLTFFITASSGDPGTILCAIWICIMGTGIISGAHFNPIVTIGEIVNQYLDKADRHFRRAICFIIGQYVSAVIGASLSYVLTGEAMLVHSGDYSFLAKFVSEVLFSSGILLIAVLVGKMPNSRMLATLSIATFVFVGIHSIGRISGACFNPAICFGVNTVYWVAYDATPSLWDSVLYLIAPILGGCLGALYSTKLVRNESGLTGEDSAHIEAFPDSLEFTPVSCIF